MSAGFAKSSEIVKRLTLIKGSKAEIETNLFTEVFRKVQIGFFFCHLLVI